MCCVIIEELQAEMRGLNHEHPRYERLAQWHRDETKLMILLSRSLRLSPHTQRAPVAEWPRAAPAKALGAG